MIEMNRAPKPHATAAEASTVSSFGKQDEADERAKNAECAEGLDCKPKGANGLCAALRRKQLFVKPLQVEGPIQHLARLRRSRPLYSGLAADLASHGYLVAVLDHPGEDQPVEFPDGSVVPPVPVDSEEALAALVPVRMADIRTALGLLARLDAESGARMHNALNLGRVALAGHSFGGAVAAEAMRLDRRVRAGVNLDGTMLGRVVKTGLDRPFLLVGSDGHEEQDPTCASFRARSPQTTTLEIAGAAHLDFTDLPALFAFRSPDEPRELLQIGPIDPRRSTKIQTAYVAGVPRPPPPRQPDVAPRRPIPAYPEVRFS